MEGPLAKWSCLCNVKGPARTLVPPPPIVSIAEREVSKSRTDGEGWGRKAHALSSGYSRNARLTPTLTCARPGGC